MRFFTVLGILFYATILILVGTALILVAAAFSMQTPPFSLTHLNTVLAHLQATASTRIVIGLSGLLLILLSFWFAQLILGRFQREKTIAFSTASGQVTIALSAVEDLIKRLAGSLPEIRELRPDVIAKKSGAIIVDLRAVLRAEANIPELTARLQDLTRSKIQEVLGIEEEIVVRIHIAKIIAADERERRKKDAGARQEPTQNFPFSGYSH